MNTLQLLELLLPVLLFIGGLAIQILLIFFVLKKQDILIQPYSGMEWSRVIWVACTILGVIIINSGMSVPVLETYKAFRSQTSGAGTAFSMTFQKFIVYFIVALTGSLLYYLISLLLLKLLPKENDIISAVKGGNLSVAIFGGVVCLGVAFSFYQIVNTILQGLTPMLLNFR